MSSEAFVLFMSVGLFIEKNIVLVIINRISYMKCYGGIMITSTANSQIKHLVLLMKKAKARKEEGVFIVEGRKMLKKHGGHGYRKYMWQNLFCRRKCINIC